jgi:uncharacterized protein YjdB
VTPQSVTLSIIGAPTLAAIGAASQVIAVATYQNGDTRTLTSACTNWTSDNPSVISVTSSGVITAISEGAATVTTLCDGVTGRVLLRVAIPAPTVGA